MRTKFLPLLALMALVASGFALTADAQTQTAGPPADAVCESWTDTAQQERVWHCVEDLTPPATPTPDPGPEPTPSPEPTDTPSPTPESTPDPAPTPEPTGSFVETFDSNTGLERFDTGVWHRDDRSVLMTDWPGDHDLNCGTPDTFRVIERSDPSSSFYTCRNHLMSSVGDTSGYSIGWFSPKQVFNGQTTVSIDVNSTLLGKRQWFEISLVPADYDSGQAGCELCSANHSAVSQQFPGLPANSLVFGTNLGGQRIMVNYRNSEAPKLCNDGANSIDVEGCQSKPIRRTWTATDNGNGTVTITLLDQVVTMPGSFPEGDWRLVIKDHNYRPLKDGPVVGFTWHWDNIVVGSTS